MLIKVLIWLNLSVLSLFPYGLILGLDAWNFDWLLTSFSPLAFLTDFVDEWRAENWSLECSSSDAPEIQTLC